MRFPRKVTLFDGKWKPRVDARTQPIGKWLYQHGVSADFLTATGIISATAAGVSLGLGNLRVAFIFLLITGLHDLLDGPVARASGRTSSRGAFFDSVLDRVTDIILMMGVTWYLISEHKGYLALLPVGIMSVASLISYERAKAESLGITAKGGVMERAERMVILGIGLLLPLILIPVLWLLLGLTVLTAVGRFVKVWRIAGSTIPGRPESTRADLVESRLREWKLRAGGELRESRGYEAAQRWVQRRGSAGGTRYAGRNSYRRRSGEE